ncbi:MAG: type IV pilin-like G/H family protein [Trichodesmium sp.]
MPTTEYGGFWNRYVASVIDGVVTSIGSLIIYVLFGGLYEAVGGSSEGSTVIYFFVSFLFGWLYFAIMESSAKQATLGKMAMRLVVTDESDNRLTFGRATARYFAKFLSFIILMIGYIIAAFTEKKQALHDMVAGTIVYQKQPSKAGGIIAAILVGLIGLVFVLSLIAVPSFLNQANKAKQSEAKQYIGSMNKGQQAYYVEYGEFSDNISDLGLGISSETENYSYDISKVRYRYVISTATAKDEQLKSYSAIVYVDDGTTTSMICETDEPSSTAPDDFEYFDECPSGSSKLY